MNAGGTLLRSFLLSLLGSVPTVPAADSASTARLLASNLAAPFCYEAGATRRWHVLATPLAGDVKCSLTASRDGKALARGTRLEFSGLTVSLSHDGWLEIQSLAKSAAPAFDLELTLESTAAETQRLSVRAAPPPRPISYIADFGDDLIDLFINRTTGAWRPLEKGAFDQYFRRLQAHGVRRLVVWQSPFPYMADPKNYPDEDWQRYAGQAQAIIESPALSAILEKRGGLLPWNWLRLLMAIRLTPQFGDLITRSAAEHGIALTASFRPFEIALEKYYAVPAFDDDGTFLWNFHPHASPAVDYHADDVGFAHYRTMLAAMGRAGAGRLHTIKIRDVVGDGRLRVAAAPFPPLQEDAFVLVRSAAARFSLRPFREIRERAEARCRELRNVKMDRESDGTMRITGIQMPDDCRYLILSADSALDAPAVMPASLWAEAGNPLERANIYWAARTDDAAGRKTRVAGITADGDAWPIFFAIEASVTSGGRRSLQREQLVIDLGDPWSVEMVDFNQAAARRYVVDELRTILSRAPFDEIFINTRSHTSLAATLGDGRDGVKPLGHYREAKQSYTHLGMDRSYAPRGAATDPRLRDLAHVERITTWQPGEWDGTCQSANSPFAWRYARNRGIADGVHLLLEELEKTFPKTRIRVVLPERAAATERIQTALDHMPKPGGGVYGRDYYRHLWASINHIPAIGEGMAMLDLGGLRAEPVFLGTRFLPDRGPFELFVRECIADMADNHGSSFRGPRSFFYEGHETLRATDATAARRGREERICHLLGQRGEINEVILYEAAAWLALPLDDPDLCGHGFLDRCE